MPARTRRPVALTIAGSDSGGGAGLQADLKTFASLGVHGTTAITSLTAQNPSRVAAIRPVPATFVLAQIEAIFEELPPRAAKSGLLGSRPIIREVARFWRSLTIPLVVDPVMVSTSGAELLPQAARSALLDDLFPAATLITPNLPEAEAILSRKLKSFDTLLEAAGQLHRQFGCAILLKGGHLNTGGGGKVRRGTDILVHQGEASVLKSTFVSNLKTHGTGCTLSAAIAAHLALGLDLVPSVHAAKRYITRAIARSYRIGRHVALEHSVPSLES